MVNRLPKRLQRMYRLLLSIFDTMLAGQQKQIEKNKKELAKLDTLDYGKPIAEMTTADVTLAIEHFRYYAGWATKDVGQTIPVAGNFFTYTRHEPTGVVGQIIPWNFPLLMAAW